MSKEVAKDVAGKEVVSVAKENVDVSGEHVLSTGVRVRINPVAARLLTDCMARVEQPSVPTWKDPERGNREIPHPNHPDYLRDMEEWESERSNVAMDAMIMFGVELVSREEVNDGVWVKKLALLERGGVIDLSEYDLSDEIEREYVFKKFVAVAPADMELLQGVSGLTVEDLAKAEESFPGDEA